MSDSLCFLYHVGKRWNDSSLLLAFVTALLVLALTAYHSVLITLLCRAHEDMDVSSHSLKRPRSVSPSPEPEPSVASTSHMHQKDADSSLPSRPPKRMRRAHANDPISNETLSSMSHGNPLNRRNMKREAKRARRVGRVKPSITSNMEVDDHMGLSGTFFNQSVAELGTAGVGM